MLINGLLKSYLKKDKNYTFFTTVNENYDKSKAVLMDGFLCFF